MRQVELPKRKKLPHEIPPWVAQGARHFITVNCKEKGTSHLLQTDVATGLLESARYYEEIGRWYLWLLLVMPDHIHFIATFDLERGVRPVVRAWKGYQKKTLGIEWQSDFFEHRLRNDREFDEKAFYVRMNPVRKSLVVTPEEWPHVIDRTNMNDGTPSEDGSAGTPRLTQDTEICGGANPPGEPLNSLPAI